MEAKFLLALLPGICLCWPPTLIHAQNSPSAVTSAESVSVQSQPVAVSPRATGHIAGVLKDPSGAVIQGAKVEIRSLASGFRTSPLGKTRPLVLGRSDPGQEQHL
jgi:hypothetical protein